jgi:hypothetical protein
MTLMQRRMALMGAKKSRILYQWTADDGLDAFTIEGTNTTPAYISGDDLVLPIGNSNKTKAVLSKSNLEYTRSYTATLDYNGAYTSTKYYEFHFRNYFVGRNIDFVWLAGGSQTPTWRARVNGTTITEITGRTFTADGQIKICYDATASKIKFYHNGDLVYEYSGSANTQSHMGIIHLTADASTTTKIRKILVTEGIS